MTALDRCLNAMLTSGTVDWVSSWEVEGIAADEGGATEDAANRALSLQAISAAVRRGLMEIGELDAVARGFRPWDASADEALARVDREWPPAGPRANSGEVCWLRNTAAGNSHAARLAAASAVVQRPLDLGDASSAIKLMPDYHCHPLWWADARIGNINPRNLPLTRDLVADLMAWAAAFDRTLNQEYPPESGFATLADADAFEAEGQRLLAALREQLGTRYKVSYHGIGRPVWGERR